MVRLFLNASFAPGCSLRLENHQWHYLFRVMRFKREDIFLVFNGQQGEWTASLGENGVICIIAQRRPQPARSCFLTVFITPLRPHILEMVVEKLTELGITHMILSQTERSQPHKINERRLERRAIEAAEQSNRLDVPFIAPLGPLADQIHAYRNEGAVVWAGDPQSPVLFSKALVEAPFSPTLQMLIGPEGGWSPQEKQTLARKGVVFVSLASFMLRAETAAMAALAIGYDVMRQKIIAQGSPPPFVLGVEEANNTLF